MNSNKIIFLQLTLLFTLAFLSCKKENLNNFQTENPSTPNEFPTSEIVFETTKNLPAVFISNAQLVLDVEEAIRSLTFRSLVQTAFHPEVHGYNGTSATTRSCPTSDLLTQTDLGGNTTYTITLDYGPGPGCSTASGVAYEGIVTIVLDDELGTDGTNIDITLAPDFKIDGNNDMDGTINFEFDNETGIDIYNVTGINLTNTNTTNNAMTTVSSLATSGAFIVLPNLVGDPIPTNALSIVNDTIAYDGCFQVACPNGQTLRSCADADVSYSIPCGTPFDGSMIVDTLNSNGTFGGVNPASGTFGNFNFAYPSAIGTGVCDGEVEFTDNINNTVEVLNL